MVSSVSVSPSAGQRQCEIVPPAQLAHKEKTPRPAAAPVAEFAQPSQPKARARGVTTMIDGRPDES